MSSWCDIPQQALLYTRPLQYLNFFMSSSIKTAISSRSSCISFLVLLFWLAFMIKYCILVKSNITGRYSFEFPYYSLQFVFHKYTIYSFAKSIFLQKNRPTKGPCIKGCIFHKAHIPDQSDCLCYLNMFPCSILIYPQRLNMWASGISWNSY